MEDPTPTEQIKWLVVLLDYTQTELTKAVLHFEHTYGEKEAMAKAIRLANSTARSARLAYRYAKELDKYNLLFDSTQRTLRSSETSVSGGEREPNEREHSETGDDEIDGTDDTIQAQTEAAAIHNVFKKMTLPLKLVLWDEAKLPAVCEHYTPDPVGPLYRLQADGRKHPFSAWSSAFLCMPECIPHLLCNNVSVCHDIARRLHREEVDHVEANGCGTDYCVYKEYYSNVTQFNEAGRALQKYLDKLSSGINETQMKIPLKTRLAFFKYGDQRIDVRTFFIGGLARLMKEDALSWVKWRLKDHWINRPRDDGPSNLTN